MVKPAPDCRVMVGLGAVFLVSVHAPKNAATGSTAVKIILVIFIFSFVLFKMQISVFLPEIQENMYLMSNGISK
jgi:hypothetical protein